MENNYESTDYVPRVKKQPVWAFCLLSFFTFGLYTLYWSYWNWRFFKELYNMDIYPIWRALFSIFFVHALLEQIDQLAREKGHPGIQSGAYATGYVLFVLVDRILNRLFPDIALLLLTTLLPFLFLIPSVNQLNAIYDQTNANEYQPVFSPGEFVVLLLGGLVMILVIAGLFMNV